MPQSRLENRKEVTEETQIKNHCLILFPNQENRAKKIQRIETGIDIDLTLIHQRQYAKNQTKLDHGNSPTTETYQEPATRIHLTETDQVYTT